MMTDITYKGPDNFNKMKLVWNIKSRLWLRFRIINCEMYYVGLLVAALKMPNKYGYFVRFL